MRAEGIGQLGTRYGLLPLNEWECLNSTDIFTECCGEIVSIFFL